MSATQSFHHRPQRLIRRSTKIQLGYASNQNINSLCLYISPLRFGRTSYLLIVIPSIKVCNYRGASVGIFEQPLVFHRLILPMPKKCPRALRGPVHDCYGRLEYTLVAPVGPSSTTSRYQGAKVGSRSATVGCSGFKARNSYYLIPDLWLI
jgi:hypothetical protein